MLRLTDEERNRWPDVPYRKSEENELRRWQKSGGRQQTVEQRRIWATLDAARAERDEAAWTSDQVEEAVRGACTCGGGGPGDCCPACEVWHRLVSGAPWDAALDGGE